jgi:hypothetical protein
VVKKFNQLTPELSKELKGFEDIFQEYVETEEEKERKRTEKDTLKNVENYELQNFLEEENSRLTNLESFFTKKIPAKMNFSQTEKLIVDQMKRKNLLKNRLNTELSKDTSLLFKNLSLLFNSHFS